MEGRSGNTRYRIRRPIEGNESDKQACIRGMQMAMGKWMLRMGGYTEQDKKIVREEWLDRNSSWGTADSDDYGFFFVMEEIDSSEPMGVIQLLPGYFFNRVKNDWHLMSALWILIKIFFMGHPIFALRFFFFGLLEIVLEREYPTVLHDHDLFVNYLAVFPKYQGMGLGTKLLEFAEEHVKEVNRLNKKGENYLGLKDPVQLTHLRLNAAKYNEGAVRCYEKFGMQKDPKFTLRWDAPHLSLYSLVKQVKSE